MRIVPKGKPTAVNWRRRSSATPTINAVLRQVVDYYHETLKQSPEALAYLESARPHVIRR